MTRRSNSEINPVERRTWRGKWGRIYHRSNSSNNSSSNNSSSSSSSSNNSSSNNSSNNSSSSNRFSRLQPAKRPRRRRYQETTLVTITDVAEGASVVTLEALRQIPGYAECATIKNDEDLWRALQERRCSGVAAQLNIEEVHLLRVLIDVTLREADRHRPPWLQRHWLDVVIGLVIAGVIVFFASGH